MKKTVAVLLALITVFMLTACTIQSKGGSQSKQGPGSTQTPAAQEQISPATQGQILPATQEQISPAMQDQISPATQETVLPPVEEPVSPQSPADDWFITADLTQEEKIKYIRSWYYDFSTYYDSYYERYTGWEGYECFQNTAGFHDLAMIRFRSALGPDGGYTMETYYNNGKPYFIYLVGSNGDNRELRLYFWNGELIRWIEKDGVVHDCPSEPNDYYQGFYDPRIAEYQEWKSQVG